MQTTPATISLLVKPAGPDCNLRCTYCFYRQKAGMFREFRVHRMSESTLKNMITQAMTAGRDLVMFSWQGGEPTLMGLDFYKRAVEIQKSHLSPGQVVTNALQTNGTLLDRRWAEFLREHNFLVGISLDGPESLHDHYRRDEKKAGTHSRVMRNLRTLLEVGTEVNILVLLNDRNVREPDGIYDFLLGTGVKFFQFVPCLEQGERGSPAFYSISSDAYGEFLCRVFDLWMDSPMDISIRDFDDLLAMRQGNPPNTCIYQPRCGGYVVVEHNGDVFPCDFFVMPKWKLGNLNETSLKQLRDCERLREFGEQKAVLSSVCRECRWVGYCYGGCLKNRLVPHGDVSKPTYFCSAYRRLFEYADSVLSSLATA